MGNIYSRAVAIDSKFPFSREAGKTQQAVVLGETHCPKVFVTSILPLKLFFVAHIFQATYTARVVRQEGSNLPSNCARSPNLAESTTLASTLGSSMYGMLVRILGEMLLNALVLVNR